MVSFLSAVKSRASAASSALSATSAFGGVAPKWKVGLRSVCLGGGLLALTSVAVVAEELGTSTLTPDAKVREREAELLAQVSPDQPERIEVRRVKPDRQKKPSLRFLQENIGFLRARIDGLESRARSRDGDEAPIDPRWLAYLEMTRDIETAESRLAAQTDELERGGLLESITELGRIEQRLKELEDLLAAESTRLDELQEDFVGRQRTTLVVLLQGKATNHIPRGLTLAREDGTEVRVSISTTLIEALSRGALAQMDHDYVEPREQWMAVSLPGADGVAGQIGYLEFAPVRDQINFIELDLDSLHGEFVEDWQARFWSRPYGEGDEGIRATW